jgi:hypothetical protein
MGGEVGGDEEREERRRWRRDVRKRAGREGNVVLLPFVFQFNFSLLSSVSLLSLHMCSPISS